MQNHTDTFKPEHEQTPLGDAKQVFELLSGIFLIAVHVPAAFWAMVSKMPGTVGTRAYWFDMLCCNTLLIALSQNWWFPDRYLFQAAIPFMTLLFLRHLYTTLHKQEHVHTHCIGETRFGRGEQGKLNEFVVGVATGLCICMVGCVPFGLFVVCSALTNMIRVAMVDERDRQRTVQLADAMAEQEFMISEFEKFQRERPNR